MQTKIRLALSTCPNDTFSFYALLTGKLGINLYLDYTLLDIMQLNDLLLRGEIDVSKGSIAIYPQIEKDYCILKAGVTVGYGCGPLIVTTEDKRQTPLNKAKIAIPGFTTTAYRLLKLYDDTILDENLVELIFSEIPHAVREKRVDFGLIIHETRFVYENYGLIKLIDLGEWWEKRFKLPLPLGCIYARKGLGRELIGNVTNSIRESIRYAWKNFDESIDFVKNYAKELDDSVIREHINVFVTESSLDAGQNEELAIKTLLNLPHDKKIFCEVA